MSDAVLFEGVTFTYPGAPAPVLAGVELELAAGSFVLVAGPTGAGKSTLVRAVNGLVPHFSGGTMSGRVSVHGRSTTEQPPRRLADLVAFVPQDPGAAFVLDRVEDELAYVMENLGVPGAVMRRRVEETLDLVGIEHLRDRSVTTLSGGERQRVAVAAALTAGPRVLVLDEPTSQLDPQGAEDVLAALQRLVHDLGMTVILAEHRLERVLGFVDVALACPGDGRVVAGSPRRAMDVLGSGPPVTRLGRRLAWDPLPLTVRDARRRAADLSLVPPAAGPPAAGEVVLEARRLRASYGERTVLSGVDFTLAAGEIVALMGRNGAGKTTLLRCLAGLHAPASGTVSGRVGPPVAGRDVALCPQTPESVLFRDTVGGEIDATLGAHLGGQGRDGVLADFGLTGLAARHPRDLSAGQRLLVATAAIAATGAGVLLLDEPTRGLDLEAKERLCAVLELKAGRGEAAVFATHDVELVAELATRVVILAGGEVIAAGGPGEVLGDSPVFAPQMARVFGPGWLTPEQVATALGVEARA